MRARLTTRYVAGLKPKDKPFQVHDIGCRGFIARVQPKPSGAVLFYFMYTPPGQKKEEGSKKQAKRRKVPIGQLGEISFQEAKGKAEELRNLVALGRDPVAEEEAERAEAERAITLRQFIDDKYQDYAATNLNSHITVMNRLRNNFEPLLDIPLADLTPFHFERHRSSRLKGQEGRKTPKHATINRDFATLRAALSLAKDWGFIERNPLDKVKKKKEDQNTTIRAIATEEETALLAVIEGTSKDSYFPTFIITLLDTGIRRGEGMTLQWASVDLKKGTLTIEGENAKSYQTRRIPLTKRALAALKVWQEVIGDEGLVFPGADKNSIRWNWDAACKAAGIKGLRLHDLRHSYASRLAETGSSVVTIKKLLGHSSITTSQRYLHGKEGDDLRAVQSMEQANVIDLEKAKGANG